MKEKELKRLSRSELLELLLTQTQETERLEKEVEALKQALSDRNLRLHNVGSLAQAVVEINGVMEAAQAAAEQYLENIAGMEQETKRRCDDMLARASAEAERIRNRTAAPESGKSFSGAEKSVNG